MRRILPAIAVALIVLASSGVAEALIREPVFTEAWIVEPQYSRPAFVDAGGEARVLVSCTGPCTGDYSVMLYTFNLSVTLPATAVDYGNGTLEVKFTVPEDLPEDLYDVVVLVNGTRAAWMPRAFYVKHGPVEALTILHMTDIHLGASDKGIPNTLKNTKYILISELVREQYGVNLAIITGDIVDVGSDVPSLREVWKQYNQFRIPTFMVPGNHDWAQVQNLQAFLENFYGRYINSKQYWYRVIDDFIIIGLDTTGAGYLSMEQIAFLNETLSEYSDKVAIIAFHHPIFNRPGEYSGPVDRWVGSVYSSWADHRKNLEAFMSVIDSHENVVLVLAGHIHRDADAIYDGRVYFITTTTANHGTPTYWGFKIIRVYSNGTVQVVMPPGKDDLFSGRTSFNAEYIASYERAKDDHTTVVWEVYASRFTQLDVSNATLYFYMNASQGPYKVFDKSGLVHGYKVWTYGDYLVYEVHASIPTDAPAFIVVSDHEDKTPPTVKIAMVTPRTPFEGTKVTVYVQAEDEGWGVADVKVIYRVNGGEWKEVDTIHVKTQYMAQIGPLPAGTLEIVAGAVDFNGNTAESEPVTLTVKARQATTTTTTTATTTTTTTATTGEQATQEQETTTTTTTAEAGEEGSLANIAVAAVIVIVVLSLLALIVRR